MGAIAYRTIFGSFTTAKEYRFGGFCYINYRLDIRSFMPSIAKWLLFAQSTSTPGIFITCGEIDGIRGCLSDNRFIHNYNSLFTVHLEDHSKGVFEGTQDTQLRDAKIPNLLKTDPQALKNYLFRLNNRNSLGSYELNLV
jgi:hypothetical protein